MVHKLKIAIGPVEDLYGGVSQHILGIKQNSVHSVHLIPSSISRNMLKLINIPARPFGMKPTNYYRWLLRKLTLNKYDVVHTHVYPWFIDLALSSRNSNCRWFHTYHMLYFSDDFPEGLTKWQLEINSHLINVASKADIKISVSKWLHKYLMEEHSIDSQYIPNGYDHRACERANAKRFTQRYGYSNFILYNGSSDSRKNPLMFVNLAMRMKGQVMLMIGRGLNPDTLKEKYGVDIPDNIVVMGELPYNDVLDAVACCKTYVMTTRREGLPTALLEAMGMAKPVVVAKVPGCEEVIDNNISGFLYEPDSLDDLVEKTYHAMESRIIGEKARQIAMETYSWEAIAKSIDVLYAKG